MNKKRVINVDGVNYSLDTGSQIKTAKVRQPVIPTPSHATDELSAAEEPVIHAPKHQPRRVSHFDGIKARPSKPEPIRLDDAKTESKAKAMPAPPIAVRTKETAGKPEESKTPAPPIAVNSKEAAGKLEEPKVSASPPSESVARAVVSHPTLPMPTAEEPPRRSVKPAIHVFLHPFVQRVDNRMAVIATARVLASWRFWLAVAAPYVIYQIYRLTTMTPNQILGIAHRLLNALPYHLILGVGLLGLGLICFSYYIGSQAAQILNAVKLKQIDHRLASVRFFYAQSDAKLFRTILSRIIHLVLFWGSLAGLAALLWYINSSTQVYLETVKLPVMVTVGLIGLVWLLLLGLRWPLARALIAATDQSSGSVESKSFKLSFGHFFKALGIAAFWSLISLIFLAAIGAIIWSLSMYLINDLSLTVKVVLSAVGIGLLGFLFTVYTTWSMVYWASAYRVLVALKHKPHLSDYLQIENPSKKGKQTLILLAVFILLGLIGLGIIGYLYQDTAVAAAKSLAHKLPDSFSNLVPRLTK